MTIAFLYFTQFINLKDECYIPVMTSSNNYHTIFILQYLERNFTDIQRFS